MSDPSLAVQKALRARLITTGAVTALVPAENILDRNARPAPDPSIILGEDQEVDARIEVKRNYVEVYCSLHIWKRELGLVGCKAIAGAIRRAVARSTRLEINDPDFGSVDLRIDGTRFIRDPGGEFSHGIVTVFALVHERWKATL